MSNTVFLCLYTLKCIKNHSWRLTELVLAEIKDAPIIHEVMIQAFQEYAAAPPPSSALSETVESIEQGMQAGEQAFNSSRLP
ncbi:hypothetical protein [Lysinibacillus fusiformis]|uniref:hypothetical protein n=1 Tax=Lysinibacillus fusiformis TaxID=28031 RepID=UPI001168B14C|nr:MULTISPECIES: hypothetical protein [Lysinibacillus]MED4669278.1 hypothetical protein [Lysinibacillus fusiformis]GED64487.1 hypothetical protein LFU01_29390 [Lysinibacillus fusiformis]